MGEYTGTLNFAPKRRDPETERLKAEFIARKGVTKVHASDRKASGQEPPAGNRRSDKASGASRRSRTLKAASSAGGGAGEPKRPNFDWTDDAKAELLRLRREGLSAAEIHEAFGGRVSKHAIALMAIRLEKKEDAEQPRTPEA